jgi:predicted dehydrogenase
VADKRTDRLQHLKNLNPNIAVTTDYHDLFNMGVDAVVVATPPATHYKIAKDCLDHGLHVLVEKPLTLNGPDAEGLIEAARARDLRLMVGNTFEYNAAVLALKNMIDSGDLGDIFYINAVRTNLGLFQTNINVMWDLAPHDISILLYLLGKTPKYVSATGRASIAKGIQDIVYVSMEFDDDLLAHVHVSWLDPRKVRQITVVGSKQMALYDDVEPLEKIKIYDKGVDAPPYSDTFADFQFSYRYGDVRVPYIKFTEPLRVECQHFVDSIINHTEPRSNGEVGLKIVRVLEAAQKSLEHHGQRMPVEVAAAQPELA